MRPISTCRFVLTGTTTTHEWLYISRPCQSWIPPEQEIFQAHRSVETGSVLYKSCETYE